MRTGLYPGTFDPVTLGHLDIFRRACTLVDKLVIGVAINRDKKPLFDLEERVAMIESECGAIAREQGIEIVVHPFENLLIQCAEEVGASVIIRGLRAVSDFEFEYQMVGMNRAMNDTIETVFLMADADYQAIASRLVKEIGRLGGDISMFVPGDVEKLITQKFAKIKARGSTSSPADIECAGLSPAEAQMPENKDAENTIIIELKDGPVHIKLLPEIAPKHCERMKELARAGKYDNVAFHRVIDGFMAQTGDVKNGNMEESFILRSAGTGGSDLPNLPAEFSNLPFDRGALGAARSQNPDSANSQFFIMLQDGHFLNGQYTVYGNVIKGQEHVDAIVRGEPPASPDRMISVKVEADL